MTGGYDPNMIEQNKILDCNEDVLKVSEIKNGHKALPERIRDKVIDDFFSRGFLCVVMAWARHLQAPDQFSAMYVVITMGMWLGTKTINAIFNIAGGNK
jgi:hypothetical protein